MISVCLATKNRPEKLRQCLKAILNNTFQRFEIILIDQSDTHTTKGLITQLQSKKIRYFKMNTTGKAKALNLAIKKAKYELLAFTDDDCVVAKDWIKTIHDTYKKFPHIAGIFGNTLAYPTKRSGAWICPATFQSTSVRFFSNPSIIHYQVLGQGNNMSLKKSIIISVGMVKEWLGVGSIAKAGEESELIFRILTNKNILMTNPNMVAYHNRWLSKNEYQFQESAYTRGLFAFYAYYFSTSYGAMTSTMMCQRIQERLVIHLRYMKHNPSIKALIKTSYLSLHELVSGIYGTGIGITKRILNTV